MSEKRHPNPPLTKGPASQLGQKQPQNQKKLKTAKGMFIEVNRTAKRLGLAPRGLSDNLGVCVAMLKKPCNL